MQRILSYAAFVVGLMGLNTTMEHIPKEEAYRRIDEKINHVAQRHALTSDIAEEAKQELKKQVDEQLVVNNINTDLVIKMLSDKIEQLLLGSVSNRNHIPFELLGFQDNYYFNTFDQENNWACGYWSIFYAFLIDYMLESGRFADVAHIRRLYGNTIATQINNFPDDLQGVWTARDDLLDFAGLDKDHNEREIFNQYNFLNNIQHNNMQHNSVQHKFEGFTNFCILNNLIEVPRLHILECNNHQQELGIWPHILASNELVASISDLTPEEKIQLKNNFFTDIANKFINNEYDMSQPRALHFVCNLSGMHWVLISIIKRTENSRPLMIIFDSKNYSIKGQFQDYVRFLYPYFIKEDAIL